MSGRAGAPRRGFWACVLAIGAACTGDGLTPPITATCTATPQPVTRTGGTVTSTTIQPAILGGDRRLWIYVPPAYDASATGCYPVLYMQDGEMIFVSGNASGATTWGMDTAATGLITRGAIARLIIVGIEPRDRTAEYTPENPTAEYSRDHPTGLTGTDGARLTGTDANGANYMRMVIQEVKPFVDARYRTRADAAATGIGGSSLGGLIAFWGGVHNSATFGQVAALSAALSSSNAVVTRDISALSTKLPLRVWYDRGTEEIDGGAPRSAVDDQLLQTMQSKGWVSGTDVTYYLQPGAAHSAFWWAQRVGLFLRFLFPPGS